jgi:hypothetical protein
MSVYQVGSRVIAFTQDGPRTWVVGAVDPPPLEPVPLTARVVLTGHSIMDNIAQGPLRSAIAALGGPSTTVRSSTGPYATAQVRWTDRFTNPDEVRGLMEAPGAAYELFAGIEAHGGNYGGRNSVATHIEYSDAFGYAVLWHNLAASTGAQTFYANFWRNEPSLAFGADWRASCDLEVPLWNSIIDHVNANKAAGTPTMYLIPWLQVYMATYDAIQAGTVTGVTMSSFFGDDVHPSAMIGRWVQLATLLAVMYRRHPDALPATVPWAAPDTGTVAQVSAGLATQLRPLIWATCVATPRTGLA